MFRKLFAPTFAILFLLIASCTDYPETPSPEISGEYNAVKIAEGLETPWNISWLPNGDMLITERTGRLRIIRDGQLLPEAVDGLPEVYTEGGGANFLQAGLFEAEPHPNFSSKNLIYLTFSLGTADQNTLAVARGSWGEQDGRAHIENVEIIFEANAWRATHQHYGGRMSWLPDGTFLLTSGDGAGYRFEAQNLQSHFGKILRLTEGGKPAPGNPYQTGNAVTDAIWSHGHRNPQGITYDPSGTVYSNEHGPKGGDEINLVMPGQNFGWPLVCQCRDYSGAQVTPLKSASGMSDPLLHWLPSIAPSSILYYSGDSFPDWKGKLFNAALAGRHIRIVDPEQPNEQISILSELGLRWRDIAQGPDGHLYAAGEGGESGGVIYRISPN